MSHVEWVDSHSYNLDIERWVCIDCNRRFYIIYRIEILKDFGYIEYEEIPLDEQNLWENKNNGG